MVANGKCGIVTDDAQGAAIAKDTTDIQREQTLTEVEITKSSAGTRRMGGAVNGMNIGQQELFRAACCNLGESFTTNPSVDVNYNDAATGAKQIKLLGLSGTYVQMLTENIPNFRGAAMPYSLGYVPGTWMKSIQVSKGASSVKNGYESITGQINVEYLKPDDEDGVIANIYGNTENKMEANATANIHVSDNASTILLTHYENSWSHHDGNDDGFQDMPNVRQFNIQNRWKYMGGRYIFHGGISLIDENRTSGQTEHGAHGQLYRIGIRTGRYEAYMKHALMLSSEHNASLALITSASMHKQDAEYGMKAYNVNEKNVYAQALYETDITKRHNIAVGTNVNYDYFGQSYKLENTAEGAFSRMREKETVAGAYSQYTYNADDKVIVMAGMRIDHSSLYGTFLTPRMHIKWQPSEVVGLRLSAGRGYRSVHALAENSYLLASSRILTIGLLDQEKAWNYGVSMSLNIPLLQKTLKINTEYYYTDFSNQAVVDYDTDHRQITIANLDGRSYSHTMHIDAEYPILKGLILTAAYRRNIVKSTYSGVRMDKPLTNKYKGLVTASYKTPLGLWQADVTLQMNGGGRMPTPYQLADGTPSWQSTYNGYAQLNAQVTRWFRHFSVYIGGENLTDFKQKNPIIDAANPWGDRFDATMIWGPVSGAMAYAGIRINIGKL
ncbi:MAG: TonB-dependent receptor [Prevotella sp.]|nr:TonB-dependent receptor [Prevotella sp.]